MKGRFERLRMLPAIVVLVAACGAKAEGGLVPPKPTVNAAAHAEMTVRLTPPEGFHGSIEATGDWVVGNHACAPKNPISGAYREEPVHLPARSKRDGSSILLTVMTDQFVVDACHWVFTGMSIKLTDGEKVVGVGAANPYLLKKYNGRLQFICNPSSMGVNCVLPEAAEHSFLRLSPRPKVYSFTIEGV